MEKKMLEQYLDACELIKETEERNNQVKGESDNSYRQG